MKQINSVAATIYRSDIFLDKDGTVWLKLVLSTVSCPQKRIGVKVKLAEWSEGDDDCYFGESIYAIKTLLQILKIQNFNYVDLCQNELEFYEDEGNPVLANKDLDKKLYCDYFEED